jgi:hypothetical protein
MVKNVFGRIFGPLFIRKFYRLFEFVEITAKGKFGGFLKHHQNV